MNDIGQALAWGFAVSQAPMMLGLMAFGEEPRAEVFNAHWHNGTFDGTVNVVQMSPLYFTASAMLAMTGVVSHQLHEQGAFDNATPFTMEAMGETGLWDWFLWLGFLAEHLVVVLTALRPSDIYCVLLVVLVQFWSAALLCCPREGPRKYDTVVTVAYLMSAGIAFGAMRSFHTVAMAASTILDLLLILGHTHDATVNMRLVANCRLSFVCGAGFLLLVMYHYP